jgi:hypothetical protein
LLLWLLLQEPGEQPVWQQLQVWLDTTCDTDDEDNGPHDDDIDYDYDEDSDDYYNGGDVSE